MIDLVFDRTQDDVNYAQSLLAKGYQNFTEDEKTLWDLGNLKGAYNISDMNRVNQAFSILLEQLTESGTIVTGYTEQPTWTDEDYITKDVLNIYIENLRVLRSYIPTMDDTPDNPSDVTAKMFNYVVANNIEKIIERCMLSLDYITSPYYYQASGDANVVSGGSSQLWRAAKVNTPSSILATYITIINATVFTTLSSSVASQADAVAELQTQVDALILDSMTATINVTSYTDNIGQTGSMVFTVTLTYSGSSSTSNSRTVGITENAISVTLAQQALMLESYAWTALGEDATSEALATAEMQAQVDDVVSNGTVDAVSYTSNSGQTGSYSFVVVLETSGISLTTSVIAVDVTEQSVVPNVEILDGMISDGVAYIDTEYYPQGGVTEVYTEITITGTTGVRRDLMGAMISSNYGIDAVTCRNDSQNRLGLGWNGSDNLYFTDAMVLNQKYTLECNANGSTVDGTFYERTGGIGTRLTVPFAIFGGYNQTANAVAYVSPYVENHITKLGENSEWLRNLVPVRILETDEVCMYDYVTQQYYKNVAGSGSFTGVSKSTPEYAYVEIREAEILEYIESDGTNYFLLDDFYANNSTDTVDAKFNVTGSSATWAGLFGAQSTAITSATNVFYNVSSKYIRLDWNGSTSSSTGTLPLGTDVVIVCEPDGVTVNNIFYQEVATAGIDCANPFYIFVVCTADGALNNNFYTIGKLYYLSIERSGEEIYSLIPVKRLSDSLITLYDTISQTYLIPLGTNAFTGVSKTTPEYVYVEIEE